MDALTSELSTRTAKKTATSPATELDKKKDGSVEYQPTVTESFQRLSVPQKTTQKSRTTRKRGREVVKAGMASSMAVTMLTGMKILRPMRFHPIAAVVFVGLAITHMLMYDSPSKK